MKKMMYIAVLCVFAGLVPARLQAQTGSSGSAVGTSATPAQKQQELAEARNRLVELQRELKSSQVDIVPRTRSSSSSRSSGYGATTRGSTSSSRGSSISTSRRGRGSMLGSDPYGSWSVSAPHAGDTLVVPAQGAGPEDIINAQDDLQVMSRLFHKQLEQAGIAPPMMDNRLFMYGGMGDYGNSLPVSAVQRLYLAGYGTVFQFKVDFPLVALAKDQDEQTDSKEDFGTRCVAGSFSIAMERSIPKSSYYWD